MSDKNKSPSAVAGAPVSAAVGGTETVTMTITVPIADADGVPIREGSVLRSIEDGEQGVVVRIVRVGDFGHAFERVGDLIIQTGSCRSRVTNRYRFWKHVPREEQTYEERYLSWFRDRQAFDYNGLCDKEDVSDDAKKAISGIMALLPEEIVCWQEGPWPDTIEDALRFLTRHLSTTAPSQPPTEAQR